MSKNKNGLAGPALIISSASILIKLGVIATTCFSRLEIDGPCIAFKEYN